VVVVVALVIGLLLAANLPGWQPPSSPAGVPRIVYSHSAHVTSPAQASVGFYVPARDGLYEIEAAVTRDGTVPITFLATYTTHDRQTATAFFQLNIGASVPTLANGSTTTQPVTAGGAQNPSPMVVYALAGYPIAVFYQDPALHPHDFVDLVVVELL
jgi:hypothetical protein